MASSTSDAAIQMEVVPANIAMRTAEAVNAAARCDAVRVEATAKISAAHAAAAHYVAARGNEAAANRVAQKAAAGNAWARAASNAREAAAKHKSRRSAAEAAALAALEASVLCAEASDQAVAAALAARSAVVPYVAAGGPVDGAYVLAAQAAANNCVEVLGAAATEDDRAAAAGRAVPRVDAAAAAAREAAAICDAALEDPGAEDDKKFLDSMRGWLMTVAVLLVNMAFTAILKPPSWLPKDFDILGHFQSGEATTGDAARPNSAMAKGTTTIALLYLLSNALTFTIAIFLVIFLLTMKKGAPAKTLKVIRHLMIALAIVVAGTFGFSTSSDWRIMLLVFFAILCYTALAFMFLRFRLSKNMF